ncbi:hypothetical protein MAP00_006706 [Monascus purpureus]|nr:hypothetical protein MAP00_006706 [Monascus purpureus]
MSTPSKRCRQQRRRNFQCVVPHGNGRIECHSDTDLMSSDCFPTARGRKRKSRGVSRRRRSAKKRPIKTTRNTARTRGSLTRMNDSSDSDSSDDNGDDDASSDTSERLPRRRDHSSTQPLTKLSE